MTRRRNTIMCPQRRQRRTLCFFGSETVPATHSLHHKSPLQDNAVKFKLYNGQFSLYLQSHTRARYDQSIYYLRHLIVFTVFLTIQAVANSGVVLLSVRAISSLTYAEHVATTQAHDIGKGHRYDDKTLLSGDIWY